ncbi:putative transcription initiation factor TFIID subunit 8 [Apostichopus japonicus]|uniref:Putative transcription initiation factor TFIID subunit 8 n=1 Tax=Stichopus japonicus TaxID=307972 RepID=A0A2G8KVJ3_STIJA|nr:putative transcription initiation factor TFIID subunit 8 [Apostichopus japonicus]
MTSTASSKHAAAHRRALSVAVAALCRDAGFDSSTESCIETLTEIVQSYIIEFGRSSKSFSELTGRTMPMVTDVAMAVSQMGSDISNLREYQRKLSRVKIPKTFKKLENTYKVVRTNAATQQRSVERALTNFIAKTTDSQTLFPGDSNLFPLIACTPSARPYSDALLPIDHDVAKESSQVNRDPVEQHPSSHDSGDRSGMGQNEDDAKTADLSSSGETPDKNKRKVDAVDVSSNPYMMKVRKPKLKKKR